MLKETAKKLFEKAQRLSEQGVSKSEISRRLHVRRATIVEWLSRSEYQDHRGWQKGHRRTHTDEEEERILVIRDELESHAFYWGKDEILKEYKKRFPQHALPSMWFTEEVIRKHGRQTQQPKERQKNITRYLGYPEHLLKALGPVQEGIDFIGRKYITGRTEPVHFLARYYHKPVGLYLVNRTENERSGGMLDLVRNDWKRFGHPHCAYLDNASAMSGPVKAKRFISRFMQGVLAERVLPIFVPQHSPWANGPVEGSNGSMFGKKVWNRFTFETVEQIDQTLEQFNRANRERAWTDGLSNKCSDRPTWHPRIHFVRYAKLGPDTEQYSTVEILNEQVPLSTSFAHQYVLGELNLEKEQLTIMVERDRKSLIIHEQRFPVQFTKT